MDISSDIAVKLHELAQNLHPQALGTLLYHGLKAMPNPGKIGAQAGSGLGQNLNEVGMRARFDMPAGQATPGPSNYLNAVKDIGTSRMQQSPVGRNVLDAAHEGFENIPVVKDMKFLAPVHAHVHDNLDKEEEKLAGYMSLDQVKQALRPEEQNSGLGQFITDYQTVHPPQENDHFHSEDPMLNGLHFRAHMTEHMSHIGGEVRMPNMGYQKIFNKYKGILPPEEIYNAIKMQTYGDAALEKKYPKLDLNQIKKYAGYLSPKENPQTRKAMMNNVMQRAATDFSKRTQEGPGNDPGGVIQGMEYRFGTKQAQKYYHLMDKTFRERGVPNPYYSDMAKNAEGFPE